MIAYLCRSLSEIDNVNVIDRTRDRLPTRRTAKGIGCLNAIGDGRRGRIRVDKGVGQRIGISDSRALHAYRDR